MTELLINWGTEFSVIVRLLALAICIIFIVPVMFRETKVKDGLKRLRYELFAYGLVHTLTNILSLYFLLDVILSNIPQKELNSWLQVINATCFLALAIIGYSIYHTQYKED